MARLMPKLLIAVLIAMAATLGGMAVFGMGARDGMAAPCDETSCAATASPSDAMSAVECVNHCLRAGSPDLSVPAAIALSLTLVAMAVVVSVADRPSPQGSLSRRRWHDEIGKYLLQRHLSVVILRD